MPRESLWSNREFVKLWAGQAISQTGSRITRTALPFAAAITLNAGPFQMGILSGAAGVSVLLFGLFAGAWAKRPNRSTETPAAPLRIPIWNGPALSVIAAAKGSAVRVIRDPVCEIACPAQSLTNSRLLHSDSRGIVKAYS